GSLCIFTPSLHDALPISRDQRAGEGGGEGIDALVERVGLKRREAKLLGELLSRLHEFEGHRACGPGLRRQRLRILCLAHVHVAGDRKSTRLNSSHVKISY